jgi:hypothetical protein
MRSDLPSNFDRLSTPDLSYRKPQRWEQEDYDRPYIPHSEFQGYTWRLPNQWRELMPTDGVLWFCNERTGFYVLPAAYSEDFLDWADSDIVPYTRGLGVSCPVDPTVITQRSTQEFWRKAKQTSKSPRQHPDISDYQAIAKAPELLELEKFLADRRWDSFMSGNGSPALRFRPQLQVLATLPDAGTPDFLAWAVEEMLAGQITYTDLLERSAREAFDRHQSIARLDPPH